MKHGTKHKIFLAVAVLFALQGCEFPKQSSSITGSITIALDEAVAPPLRAALDRFGQLYKDAKLSVIVTSSREALILLAEKKAHLVFLGRDLLEEERNAFSAGENARAIKRYPVARQAYGLIVHRQNLLRALSRDDLSRILRGELRQWDPLGPELGGITIVMGGPNSSTYISMKEDKLFDSLRCHYKFAEKSDQIDSICALTPGALGIQPLAWLPHGHGQVRNLDMFSLIPGDTTNIPIPVSTHLANIYREYYPLRSTVYAVHYDEGVDLAVGVISFITGAVGQKTLLNKGFVPATMPVRLIQFGQSSGEQDHD